MIITVWGDRDCTYDYVNLVIFLIFRPYKNTLSLSKGVVSRVPLPERSQKVHRDASEISLSGRWSLMESLRSISKILS